MAKGKEKVLSEQTVGEKAKSGVKRIIKNSRGGTRNDQKLDNPSTTKDTIMAISEASNQAAGNGRRTKGKALDRVPPSRRLEPIEMKKRVSA